MVGMLEILYFAEVSGFSSTFSLHILIRPEYSAAISSITGPIILHGPHHGAQQSSRTGTGDFSTISLKLLSVTASGFPLKRSFISSSAEHLPHFAVKPGLSAGILFFVPQA
jgi:hypothetical protein